MKTRIAITLIGALALFSCKDKDPVVPLEFHHNYLPLKVGSYIDYAVDSTVHDDFSGTATTYSFILRETVAEQFEDAEGRTAYRIERSRKHPDSLYFDVAGSYALVVAQARAERMLDNERVVVLKFPPQAGDEWDGNAFNTNAAQTFTYAYVHRAETFGAFTFDSTLRVVQTDDTGNVVINTFLEERYATGVGLVYKEHLHIETNFGIDSGLHWVQVIAGRSK